MDAIRPGRYACIATHLVGFPKDRTGSPREMHFAVEPRSFAVELARGRTSGSRVITALPPVGARDYAPAERVAADEIRFTSRSQAGWLSLKRTALSPPAIEFVLSFLVDADVRFLSGDCTLQD